MTAKQDIFREISDIIKDNGDVPERTRNQLLLLATVALNDQLEQVHEDVIIQTAQQKENFTSLSGKVNGNTDKIAVLERNNIILWVRKNKTLSATVLVSAVLFSKVILVIAQLGLALAGVPDEIIKILFQ